MKSRRVDEWELIAATDLWGGISLDDFTRSKSLLAATSKRSSSTRETGGLLLEIESRIWECGSWQRTGATGSCYPFRLRDNRVLEVNPDVNAVFKDTYLFLLLSSYVPMNAKHQRAGGENGPDLFEEVTKWALHCLFGPRMEIRIVGHRGSKAPFSERLRKLFTEIGLTKSGSRIPSSSDQDGDMDLVAWFPWGSQSGNGNPPKRGAPLVAVAQCKTGQQHTPEIAAAQSRGRKWFSKDELSDGYPLYVFAVSAQPEHKAALECSSESFFLDRCRHMHAISLDGIAQATVEDLVRKMRAWSRAILETSKDLPITVQKKTPSWW